MKKLIPVNNLREIDNVDDNDYIHLKNTDDINPLNIIADYQFGRVCQEHYDQLKNELKDQIDFDFFEKSFQIAIKYGLTYEDSTSGVLSKKYIEIWERVEREMKCTE